MQLGLDGLVVLVTGGTRGIGRAIVEAFLAEGAKVAYCARSVTGNEFSSSLGKTKGTALDVADTPALRAWVADAAEAFGGIDVVISNGTPILLVLMCAPLIPAAVSHNMEGAALDAWPGEFDTDFRSYAQLFDACLPHLRRSSAPAVVAMGSDSGCQVGRAVEVTGPGVYGALKAAVIHYSQQLAFTYASEGIRVNTVSPGGIMHPGSPWDMVQKTYPDMYQRFLEGAPMKRFGQPEEVAATVVFLASRKCSYTTGTNVRISGGVTRGIQL